jgi:serine/threonine protein kinase/tetratricopeptide (TPR) repeat protein
MFAPSMEEIFSSAISFPSAERESFLDRACGEDAQRRAHLRDLLAALPSSSTFIREQERSNDFTEDLIDNYRVIEELGQGAGGVVYRAEQLAPIKRDVALKITKLGMDTREVINRFEAERQALAMMDHPNIAKVFFAGATAGGRPYFVMELVRGIRITDYCNQCRLSIAERLELLVQVCDAIEHAHQQHIVHRDIKPSNVLVTLHGGTPIAKVIDFGVAKATHGRLTDATLFTLVDQFVGTPAYVSPEQTGLDPSSVDARSDIYSLGVLLYELLTASTPLDARELAGETLDEVRRRIREEAAQLPSKRLREMGPPRLNEAAARCKTSPAKLLRGISGDLDWIAARCLEKDRARRYRSARDLAADVVRHLEGRPVFAGPPTWTIAFRRFAARHRLVLVAVSSVIGALMIATGISTWQAVRARNAEKLALRERESAEQVSRFLLNIFNAFDPYVNFGREPLARDLLDRAALNIRSDLTAAPDVRARLLEGIGRSYRRIGETEKAANHLREALRLKHQASGDRSSLGALLVELAAVVREQGDIAESDRLSAAALVVLSQSEEQQSVAQADLLAQLGSLENWRGHSREALNYTIRSMELLRELKGPDHAEVGAALTEIANLTLWTDDFDAAERASREAVRIFEGLPAEHPGGIMARYQLGDVLFYRGDIVEAEKLFERALEMQRRLPSGDGPTVNMLGSLAQVRLMQGRIDEAANLVLEAIQMHRASGQVNVSKDGYLQTMLGMVRIKDGNFAEAEQLLTNAIELLAAHLPLDHPYIASAEHYLGEALVAQKKYHAAQGVLTSAIERWKSSDAPRWRSARSESVLGQVLHELKQRPEAERHLVSSFRVLMTNSGVDEETKQDARERVRRFFEETERVERLAALLAEVSGAEPQRATTATAN